MIHECPYCRVAVDVHEEFQSRDCSPYFEFDCPQCGQTIEVEVHSVPEFELRTTGS